MSKQEIKMSAVKIRPEQGDTPAQYKFEFHVGGEEGVDFFNMIAEFLHQCPPWVADHLGMAVDFHREHDRANCPHCRPQS